MMNEPLENADRELPDPSSERTAAWLVCALQRVGNMLPPGTRLLDMGCGNGELVNAFRKRDIDAFGCDLQFNGGLRTKALLQAGVLKPIEQHPYKLPFDDDTFDIVVSVSVLEHVMNVSETFKEMSRITRPGGGGLHMFPSRYRFIEPHTFVPLGTVLRTPAWLKLWALLGIKNSFQTQMSATDIAAANDRYLHQSTNYLTRNRIREEFAKGFATVRFCEELMVSCAAGSLSNRVGLGRAMEASTALTRLYSALRERVVWAQKR